MATQIQWRRGNTAQTAALTGAVAEVTVDTDKKTLVVHDGTTAGGIPLAKESVLTAAFAQANTDYTTISTTAGTFGNASYVPVFTVAANGRITAVTNTAITGSGATIGDVLALSIALG